MRQIFLTKEDLIRYLDPLDPSSRIEFGIQHAGKAYRVDHIRGFSRDGPSRWGDGLYAAPGGTGRDIMGSTWHM